MERVLGRVSPFEVRAQPLRPESKANREFAARFVARAVGLKAEDFPADVQLVYQVWPTNRPNAPADEPPASPWTAVIETYTFPTLAEAQP